MAYYQKLADGVGRYFISTAVPQEVSGFMSRVLSDYAESQYISTKSLSCSVPAVWRIPASINQVRISNMKSDLFLVKTHTIASSTSLFGQICRHAGILISSYYREIVESRLLYLPAKLTRALSILQLINVPLSLRTADVWGFFPVGEPVNQPVNDPVEHDIDTALPIGIFLAMRLEGILAENEIRSKLSSFNREIPLA